MFQEEFVRFYTVREHIDLIIGVEQDFSFVYPQEDRTVH